MDAYKLIYYSRNHPSIAAPFEGRCNNLAEIVATACLIILTGGRAANVLRGEDQLFNEEELKDICTRLTQIREPEQDLVELAERVIVEQSLFGKESGR